MICPKCNGRNAYCTGCGADLSGFSWEMWYCPECGHSYTRRRKTVKKNSKSVAVELPDEIEINGIKYRRVCND